MASREGMSSATAIKPSWLLLNGSVIQETRDQASKSSSQVSGGGFRNGQWRGVRSANIERRSQLLPSRPNIHRTLSSENLRKAVTPTVETITEVLVHKDGSLSSKTSAKTNFGAKPIDVSVVDAFLTSAATPTNTNNFSSKTRTLTPSQLRQRSARAKGLGVLRSGSSEVIYPAALTAENREDLDERHGTAITEGGRTFLSNTSKLNGYNNIKRPNPAHKYFGPTRINLYHPLYSDVSHLTPQPSPSTTKTTPREKRNIRSADVYGRSSQVPSTYKPRSSLYREPRNIYGVLNLNPSVGKTKNAFTKSQETSEQNQAEGCEKLQTQVSSFEIQPQTSRVAKEGISVSDANILIDDDFPSLQGAEATSGEPEAASALGGINVNTTDTDHLESCSTEEQQRASKQDTVSNKGPGGFEVVGAQGTKQGTTSSENWKRPINRRLASNLKLSDYYHVTLGDNGSPIAQSAKPRARSDRPGTRDSKRSVRFSTENQVHEFDIAEPVIQNDSRW